MNIPKFTINTFYQFKNLKKLDLIQNNIRNFCFFHKIRGTIILANEGINGTVAGSATDINLFNKNLINLKFDNLELKTSFYEFMPFNRMKVKIKKEIVKFNSLELDVEKSTAKHINFSEWNNLINDKNTILIDVRNDFEYKMGSFVNSINPNTQNFSEFKIYINKSLSKNKDKKIAMFCTGGIRCEKASSYMLNKGFKNVFQLQGGILKYLENTHDDISKWQGECFVFDNRVSVKNKLLKGTYAICHGCRYPVSPKEQFSSDYERGISCPKCIDKVSNEKKTKLKERNKQINISKKRGLYNPYIKYTPLDFF